MAAIGNQDTIETLIKIKMDIKQFEANLSMLERKMSVTQKEMQDSMLKVGQAANKSSIAMNTATNAKLAADRQIIKLSQEKLAMYRAEQVAMEKQIILANQLASSKAKSFTWSTKAPTIGAATAPQATIPKDTGLFARIKEMLVANTQLDESIKKVDNTAKNSFPHKVSTTAQYMAAGAMISGVVTSIYGMGSAIMEADKAFNMFQGVLEMTSGQAKQLQGDIFKIGTTFGGSLTDLNESALALGRAGLASGELAGALKVVSQAALVSGDTLGSITELLVSWKTVHPEETIQHLGDMMTKVANDSLASFDDFKTMTNYLLTSTETMGMTAQSTIALAGAWRNLGKGASTTGTEVRRFMDQISNGSDEVNKAYGAMGVNLDKVQQGLAQGGKVAEATMAEVYRKMGEHPKEFAAKAGASLQTLDKATFNSNVGLSKRVQLTSEEMKKYGISMADSIVTAYEKMVLSADHSAGALEEANNKIQLSYTVMWERVKNSMSEGSNVFATAFKDGFIGASTTVGDFNSKMSSFSTKLNETMQSAGESIGILIAKIVEMTPYIEAATAAWLTYRSVVAVGALIDRVRIALVKFKIAQAALTVATGEATAAQVLLNIAVSANPYVLAAVGLATLVGGLYLFIDANDRAAESERRRNGIKQARTEEDAFGKTLIGKTRDQQIEMELSHGAALSADRATKKFSLQSEWGQIESNAKSVKADIEQINRQIAQSNRRLDLIKVAKKSEDARNKPSSPPKVDISGTAALKGNKPTQASIESVNKNLLDEEIQRIRLKEQQYFYDNKITSELEQQKYHVSTTLKDELKATEGAGFYKNKLEDTLKVKVDIWKASRAIQESEYQSALDYSRKIEDLETENSTIGIITEKQKIISDAKSRELVIDRTREDLKHAGLYTDEQIYQISIQMLENSNKLTIEQERQLLIAQRLRQESADLTSLQIQATNATSGAEQIALEKQIIRQKLQNEELAIGERYKTITDTTGKLKQQELDNARALADQEERKVEGAQSYYDLLIASNLAYERQNSTAQSFMRISEAGISALSTGLTSYFTIGDEGYGKWATLRDSLTQAIIKGLLQELVVNQMILQVRQAMAAASAGGGSGLLGGLVSAGIGYFTGGAGGAVAGASGGGSGVVGGVITDNIQGLAKGGVVGQPNYLAKGGYVNSIVKKPTYVAKGTIAGESGAESVMPLQRDSQGRLGVIASGGSSAPQSVTVNIVNESGEKLAVTKSEAKTDMSGMVLDIVIDAISRNKRGMRDIVRG